MAGRPTKYDPSYHPKTAIKLALTGFTNDQMADFFEVNVDTIHEWRKKHPEFSDAIKSGKDVADSNVASSLYQRALGQTKKIQKAIKLKKTVNGEGSEERVEMVEEEIYIPPDTTAQIFWLKNRQPKIWCDKKELGLTDENGKDLLHTFKIEIVPPREE